MNIESLYSDYSDHNFFWFIRDLTKSKYDGFGNKTEKCLAVHRKMESEIGNKTTEELLDTFEDEVLSYYTEGNNNYYDVMELITATRNRVNNKEDIKNLSLALYCTAMMSKHFRETELFTEEDIDEVVRTKLLEDGSVNPNNAFEILLEVDARGEHLNLSSQRDHAVAILEEVESKIPDDEKQKHESAIIQWYEMKCGQSRKKNAGNVLERALDDIFQVSGIPSEGSPEHLEDLEIDNKVSGPEGTIGLSCKRTQRERLKQSYPRQQLDELDEIWFVTLQLGDVSESRLKEMSEYPIRMYVPQDSKIWQDHGENEELEEVLYPAEEFLKDMSDFTGNSFNPQIVEQQTLN